MKQRKHKCPDCMRSFYSKANNVYRCSVCRVEHNRAEARKRSRLISSDKSRFCCEPNCNRRVTTTSLRCEPCRVKRRRKKKDTIAESCRSLADKESLMEACAVMRESRRTFTVSEFQHADASKFEEMVRITVRAW